MAVGGKGIDDECFMVGVKVLTGVGSWFVVDVQRVKLVCDGDEYVIIVEV